MTKDEARAWLRGKEEAAMNEPSRSITIAVPLAELCRAYTWVREYNNHIIMVDGQQSAEGAWRSISAYPKVNNTIDWDNPTVEYVETAEGNEIGLFIINITDWTAQKLSLIVEALT
jgi:hypothetical protein